MFNQRPRCRAVCGWRVDRSLPVPFQFLRSVINFGAGTADTFQHVFQKGG